MKRPRHPVRLSAAAAFVIVLAAGTFRDPDFWRTADRRGDALMAKHRYAEAAKIYRDPLRLGISQYRDGQFEAAAATFARVPGAAGAYNTGNAWLMHGQYDSAIASFDRALGFRPGWQDAADNKALAIVRRDRMQASDKDRADESADAYDPDEIVVDNKGGNDEKPREPEALAGNDTALQATWLRRVKTTPAEFLKAKFAWQAQSTPEK